LATTLESLLSGNLTGKYRDVVNGRWCCRTMRLGNEQTGMDNFCSADGIWIGSNPISQQVSESNAI